MVFWKLLYEFQLFMVLQTLFEMYPLVHLSKNDGMCTSSISHSLEFSLTAVKSELVDCVCEYTCLTVCAVTTVQQLNCWLVKYP